MRALVHECGADATVADKDGDTPVSLASQNGHTETVRALDEHQRRVVRAGLWQQVVADACAAGAKSLKLRKRKRQDV